MKKKKILVGIGIYWLICGVLWIALNEYRLNLLSQSYLKEFKKSSVLVEKYGEITKVGLKFTDFFKTTYYDEDKYVVDIKIYTKDNKKYKIQAIYYSNSSRLFGYLIDGELVYEKEEYQKTTILKSDNAFTDILVKYNGKIYGKSYSVIDYIGNPDGPVGVIDKLTDKENIPKYDGETNTEELLNAIVDASGEEGLVLQYNNDYVLFRRIDY